MDTGGDRVLVLELVAKLKPQGDTKSHPRAECKIKAVSLLPSLCRQSPVPLAAQPHFPCSYQCGVGAAGEGHFKQEPRDSWAVTVASQHSRAQAAKEEAVNVGCLH